LTKPASGPGLVVPTLAVLVCMALLIGLGVWQLQRKVWKENLIAAMTARLGVAPQPLPPQAQWGALKQDEAEFRRVSFTAQFVPGEEALVYAPGSALRSDIKGFRFQDVRALQRRHFKVFGQHSDHADWVHIDADNAVQDCRIPTILRYPESMGNERGPGSI